MKYFHFLIGLSLFIFYPCIGTTNGQNKCVECKNLLFCSPGQEGHSAKAQEDKQLVVDHNNKKFYHPDLPCVPTDYEIKGTIKESVCFHHPYCKMVVGSKTTGKKLIEYCNGCNTDCNCKDPELKENIDNKCWNCHQLEKCVGPGTISTSPRDKNAITFQNNNITYHPDLECIPEGYELSGTTTEYLCFHKPYCKMVVGFYTTGRVLNEHCKKCAEHCKCGAVISSSASLISIVFGISARLASCKV